MVSRPRRDAHVGDIAPRGNRRDERLRPVTAGHPDGLRAARDSALGELEQIVARLQDDRLDATPLRLGNEVEALGLAATRLQVDDQRRRAGRTHRHHRGGRPAERILPRTPQRVARGQPEQPEQQQQRDQHQQPLPVSRQHHD